MEVAGLPVEVLRKPIKNLHLGVYPPDGRIRVATPLALTDDAVRAAVLQRLGWIHRQQAKFTRQQRQPIRDMVSGESHYYLGRRYRLRLLESAAPPSVRLQSGRLELHAPSGATPEHRAAILATWYRQQLRQLCSPLVAKWQAQLEVQPLDWRIKRMKTKWGSCGTTGRVWFNLELAKKPPECIEYIVVHELVHLAERRHGPRFTALLDTHLPDWRRRRDLLNDFPLAEECW